MDGIGNVGGRRLARVFGPLGIWSSALQRASAAEAGAAVRDVEAIGYPITWIPETLGGKELFSLAGVLLAATDRLAIGSGIANIHARDPLAMANGARTLGEAYPGRFVLGIGVSHAPSVATRGGTYGRPIEMMRAYLDAMAAVDFPGPVPDPPVPLVLAALGPRMLELAAERADGAHPYFVPVDHTPFAREHLGPEPFLVVEQTAVAHDGPGRGSPDRAGLREDLPGPAQLREQPAPPGLGRGRRDRGRKRPTHRCGRRLG